MPERMADRGARSIGYVLKGFPRLSELFIASEIHRLETLGLPLRLYVIKPSEETTHHTIVDEIRARPEYLPAAGSVSTIALRQWLAQHFPAFAPSLRRVSSRRPIGIVRAAGVAGWQSVRDRRGLFPRKVYVKEFLQAAALADRVLDDQEVTHLHAHFCHGATTVTWLASLITGLPFSFTAHAKDLYCPSLNPAGLLRRKIAAASFVVTCTDANRQFLTRLANGTPVYCVYHGLNAELARLLQVPRPSSARGDGEVRILGVGRLVRKKGFDVLVDALAALRRRGIGWRAVIVGEDGDAGDDIRRRIAAHALGDRITLRGPLPQMALYDEYRRADVLCLPCRIDEDGDRDGIPNVLVEAMACGVPAITTAVSGIPEVVRDGETGLIVPVDDPVATARAIERLAADRALAARIAEKAAAQVRERFDGDRLAGDLARLFREAVA
jgi:glycosyltransferase involved in cell wall biosynthesis